MCLTGTVLPASYSRPESGWLSSVEIVCLLSYCPLEHLTTLYLVDQKKLPVNFAGIFQCNGKTKIVPQKKQGPTK